MATIKRRKKAKDTRSVLDLVQAEAVKEALIGKNRAAVHALRDEISDVAAHGYTWKVIWKALMKKGTIEMSYEAFCVHCRALGIPRPGESHIRAKTTKRDDDEQ